MEEEKVVTQEGATEQSQAEKSDATGFHDKRAAMLEVIASKMDQQFEEPADDKPITATPGTPPDDHMEVEPKSEEPEPKRVKLTIYGQEKEVTEEEVLEAGKKALQKTLAADKTLEEARKVQKEVEQLKEHILRSLPQGAAAKEPVKSDAEQLHSWVSAIRYGTEEEATAAFSQALEAMKPKQQLDYRTVGQIVTQQLGQAQIIDKFKSDPANGGFGDIANDPYLNQIATIEAEKLIQSGRSGNDWETYAEAGRITRAWRDQFKGVSESVTPDPMKEKQDRKKSIDHIPSASARTVTGDKQPVKEKTQSEIIAEMQAKRMGGK